MQTALNLMETQQRHWNAREVARRLGMAERTVRRHIKAGKLGAVRPGRAWIISKSDLVDYLDSEQRFAEIFDQQEENS